MVTGYSVSASSVECGGEMRSGGGTLGGLRSSKVVQPAYGVRGEAQKMPHPERRSQRDDKLSSRPKGNEKELQDLKRLLALLTTPLFKQQTAGAKSPNPVHSNNDRNKRSRKDAAAEAAELENFSARYRDQRHFRSHPHHKVFRDVLTSLVKNRLGCREWLDRTPPDGALRLLICLRLFIRDPHFQKVFHEVQGSCHLSAYMDSVSDRYLNTGVQTQTVDHLVTMTYIFQKLAANEELRSSVIECGAHTILVKLLSSKDSNVILGALLALTTLAESPDCKQTIGELSLVQNLLVILQEYDLLSRRMSAELLRLLCPVRQAREQLKACEGVPVLLSLLHSDHLRLLWSTVWVLVQLCQDLDMGAEIRAWGGVQQLLRLLHAERAYVSDRSSVETLSSANAAGRIQRQHISEDLGPQETAENIMILQSACCAAITELVLDDTTARHVVQENGVYIIAKLTLPKVPQSGPKAALLQCYAFRTLRFLFSREQNRQLFKRLFPAEMLEMFIDVGHYVRDIAAYEGLQQKLSLLADEDLNEARERIESVNQNRPPLRVVSGYAVLGHLGSGAFGNVFKVRKQNGQNFLALKEIDLHSPVFGKDKKTRDSSVEKIVSELTIIKEQMSHPNIVKYFKTFVECDRLYIVMELIEGVSLADHFSALKDKQQQFTEERVWIIFIQLCLALRYLHKEKRIVHRDLSPNNIMLGERDKVTITDFGLAKQKDENSKLTSVVGTILYSCPEIVKNEPYGEKADVWAIGCILYQLATLRPPFYSTNMLSLATKIVEAVYEPVGEGVFSERMTELIKWCLTPDPDSRPDIVEVSTRICDIMMRFMDNLCNAHNALERRAERDRKRAQKYFLESNKTRHSQWPTPVSQGISFKEEDWAASLREETISRSPLFTSPVQQEEQGTEQAMSNASSSVPVQLASTCGEFVLPKARPASAGICVSQRKVRQIEDPVQRLIGLLHKIVYICQHGSKPNSLKEELAKVLQGSSELLETGSGGRRWWPTVQTAESGGDSGHLSLQEGITYEQMQTMIEEELEENGYYRAA
ncbi:serine/threonine-protein kinase Nek10 isoform X2 [Denticeps clupeoides]|uniref:serine/threonine-protein kinase Nek10 isoform X2 n=1 Tax=Denticeps clupeoides TaxID=299321 RepID=UPI0010A509D8|nr:serine/threonine-protein kinase Nek10 isoform X2 [Denticeps clupeoides]